jgi:DNA-binding NtrC family response regulator
MSRRVLHVEDEKWFHDRVRSALESDGSEVVWAEDTSSALAALRGGAFDLILLDRSLGGSDSFEALPRLRELAPDATLIVLSADTESEVIARALALGAHDYLIKTRSIGDELTLRIGVADRARRAMARPEVWHVDSRLIGPSEHTAALREKARKVAPLDIGVLITGESGTGKEVFATEVHRLRGDPRRPFVALNCGAIPESVFESELFGHVRGAFTGAVAHREGLIRAADGGDLFLDEVGDMPLSQQVKLLRFLQEGTFTPVGATREQRAKVRIIAATNAQLEEEVRQGFFREDLFYRLDVYRVHLQPLRERPEDIAPLAEHFARQYGGPRRKVSREACKLLERLEWKGNVRELAVVIQRALVESGGEDLRSAHFQAQNVGLRVSGLPRSRAAVSGAGYRSFVDAAARAYLEAALDLYSGDTRAVAEALQISRATVYNRIHGLKLERRIKNGK